VLFSQFKDKSEWDDAKLSKAAVFLALKAIPA